MRWSRARIRGYPLTTPEGSRACQPATKRRAACRLGGRPPKPTHDEAREEALKRLAPRALQKLEEQLDSGDKRIAQTAALRILEWHWGKATTPLEDVTDNPEFLIWEDPGVERAARLKVTLEEQERRGAAGPGAPSLIRADASLLRPNSSNPRWRPSTSTD